ncbi:MAG: hypothetical protein JNJ53_13680 [Rhizobiales bacterium]|nr:hypothetical protein [Hyphomicrobiales bacterium]
MPVDEDEISPDAHAHPEEIRADCELRVGKLITMQASARITPAGVISAGIAAAAIILAVGFLVSSSGRRKTRSELQEPELRRLRDH